MYTPVRMKHSWIGLVLLAACGGGDPSVPGGGLARDDVDHLPAGTGTGTAASGEYRVEMLTIDCLGTCPVVHSGPFSASTCDVDQLDHPDLDVTQTDGALVMDAEGLVVDRLAGGIDADGRYVVGAYGTQASGDVDVFVRSTGTLDGEHFTGMAESHGVGSVNGTAIDCTAIYEVTGERR